MKILLAITFVFGVLKWLTYLKIFDLRLGNPFSALTFLDAPFWKFLDVWFFYFSLCFQAWYWLF